MRQVRIISLIARWILMILFFIAPLAVMMFWLTNGASDSIFDLRLLPTNFIPISELPVGAKIICFLLTLIPTAIGMLILFNLSQLFAHCERGEIFEIRNVFYIKVAALAIFIWEIDPPFL